MVTATTPNGLNVIELKNNDQVNFYYAPNKDPNPVVNATAVVKIKVNTAAQPTIPDWTLSLNGAKTTRSRRPSLNKVLPAHRQVTRNLDGYRRECLGWCSTLAASRHG